MPHSLSNMNDNNASLLFIQPFRTPTRKKSHNLSKNKCVKHHQFSINNCHPRSVGYERGKAREETRVHLNKRFTPGTSLELPQKELHHLRARRIRNGQTFCLFNNHGETARAVLQDATATILACEPAPAAAGESAASALSVVIGLPKSASRADWCVEKLTELGVGHIYWARTRRSEHHGVPSARRMERWDRVAISAAKQSLRNCVPTIDHLDAFGDVVALVRRHASALVLSSGGDALLCEENMAAVRERRSVLLIVGPEGGLTDAEECGLVEAGARRIGLGPMRLRVETAVITAAATVSQMVYYHDARVGE